MTDTDTPDPLVKVARDLREIQALAAQLLTQAVHHASSKLMPGGEAMAALGPCPPSPQAYSRMTAHRVVRGEDTDETLGTDPLYELLWWSEGWRADLDADMPARPTIAGEAAWLAERLVWAWENELAFGDFAADVRKVRVYLESVLYAGKRADRTRVPCNAEGCERHPWLVKVWAAGREADDRWKCPSCKRQYDGEDFYEAYAKHLRSEGAERWVSVTDAVAVLRAQGRNERTVRGWLYDFRVPWLCEVGPQHRQWLWWPALWSLHLDPPRRGPKAKGDTMRAPAVVLTPHVFAVVS